jgi:hypothetical protein
LVYTDTEDDITWNFAGVLACIKKVARDRNIVAKWKDNFKLWITTSEVAPHLPGMVSKEP